MTFMEFAESYGLIIQSLIADGLHHAVKTVDKPKHRNGRYLFDGVSGWAINWATMDRPAVFRSDKPVSKRDNAELARKAAQAEREKHAASRIEAKKIISECSSQKHEYLARKGFPDAVGLVHPSGDLIIPMRDHQAYGTINSVQRIAVDGTKKFLTGGKAKGSIFRIGDRGEKWLVEGYATALSLHMALKDMYRPAVVTACFSAGNLVYVAKSMKQAFVFADHDKSLAGQDAAKATGFPWVMAETEGFDCNDIHQRLGLRAVVKLVLTL